MAVCASLLLSFPHCENNSHNVMRMACEEKSQGMCDVCGSYTRECVCVGAVKRICERVSGCVQQIAARMLLQVENEKLCFIKEKIVVYVKNLLKIGRIAVEKEKIKARNGKDKKIGLDNMFKKRERERKIKNESEPHMKRERNILKGRVGTLAKWLS